jgi:hypothetical protein
VSHGGRVVLASTTGAGQREEYRSLERRSLLETQCRGVGCLVVLVHLKAFRLQSKN